ncbi:unnamed protein product [Oikopleura dioica]|uniref:Uncharacterized protein n=1 Tax=Oikopleura dioica TaxID=34765 RepID=E4X2B3_OIKDI|nr:unnamed protein product [Oikopleura dioica]
MKLRSQTPQLVKQLTRVKRVRTVIRNLSKNAVAKPRKRTADSLDHTIEPKPSPKKLKRRATKRPARPLSPVLEVKRVRSGRARGLNSESDWLDFPFDAVKVEPESSSEEDMSVLYASGPRFNDSLFHEDDELCDVSLIEVAESLNLPTPKIARRKALPAPLARVVLPDSSFQPLVASRKVFGDISTAGRKLSSCEQLFPEYPSKLLLLFRENDDLFVPHSIYDYRSQYFKGLKLSRVGELRQRSPFISFVPFLTHIACTFTRSGLPVRLNFDLSFPPRVTVDDNGPCLNPLSKDIASFLTLFLESNYRYFNGECLLASSCPSIFARLASEMQQLADAYFLLDLVTLGRPADLAI